MVCMKMQRRFPVVLAALAWCVSIQAHEVPPQQYDRTIVVRLLPGRDADHLLLEADYRLEVAPATIVTEDALPFREFIDIHQVKTKLDWFARFVDLYGPVIGQRLLVQSNGRTFDAKCVRSTARLEDEKGEPLGHLRCDWRFQVELPLVRGQEQELAVRELNYPFRIGKIDLTLRHEADLLDFRKEEAPETLRQKENKTPTADEEKALREVRGFWRNRKEEAVTPPPAPTPGEEVTGGTSPRQREHGLLDLFLHSDLGLVGMLLLAAAIGAVHALTPGHGKTMVAAYLVGQRGTVGHACVLGLVTTLTHTGIVLMLAAGLLFLPDHLDAGARRIIEGGIGLVLGLAIFCLGVWLLLQRLSGRADHFHVGGGHHHHHHGHTHEPASLTSPEGEGGPQMVTWWGLVLLGISGGIVPCWDAIAMLVLAVGMNLFWLALPLLLAFSAGLAGVLVLLGILVVKVRGLAGSRWGEGRLVRSLPILSALFIAAMGMWLCWEGVQGLQ